MDNYTPNFEAFSIHLNWDQDLYIKYKGISIDTLKYEKIFNAGETWEGRQPFEYYVKIQGKAIYDALKAGKNIPEEYIKKAKAIDDANEGIEDSRHWESSAIFEADTAEINIIELEEKLFSPATIGDIVTKLDSEPTVSNSFLL